MLNFIRSLFRSKHSKSSKKSSQKEKGQEPKEELDDVFIPFDFSLASKSCSNLDELRPTQTLNSEAHRMRSEIRRKVRPPTKLLKIVSKRQAVVMKEKDKHLLEVNNTPAPSGFKSNPEAFPYEKDNFKKQAENSDVITLNQKDEIEEKMESENEDRLSKKSESSTHSDSGMQISQEKEKNEEKERIFQEKCKISTMNTSEKELKGCDVVKPIKTVVHCDTHEEKQDASLNISDVDDNSLSVSHWQKEDENKDKKVEEKIEYELKLQKNTAYSMYDNIKITQPVTKTSSFSTNSRQQEPEMDLKPPSPPSTPEIAEDVQNSDEELNIEKIKPQVNDPKEKEELKEEKEIEDKSTISDEEEKESKTVTTVTLRNKPSIENSSVEEEENTCDKPAWVAMALKRSSVWKDPEEDNTIPNKNPIKDKNVENKPSTKPAISKPKPSFIPKNNSEEPLFQKHQDAEIVKPSDLKKSKSIRTGLSPLSRLNRQSAPAVERPLEVGSTESNVNQSGKPSRVSSLTKKWESVR